MSKNRKWEIERIKIAHVEEAQRVQLLPQMVAIIVDGITEILDNEYLKNRDVVVTF